MLTAPQDWDELVEEAVWAVEHGGAQAKYLLVKPRAVLEVESWLEEVTEIVERYGQIMRVLQEGGSEGDTGS